MDKEFEGQAKKLLERFQSDRDLNSRCKKKLTPSQKADLVHLYIKGKTKSELSREFGITIQTVGYHLERAAEKSRRIVDGEE